MRRALARAKQFHLYYRDPREVARVMTGAGFRQTDLVTGHSFTIMAFRRA
jgi:hypothetical protein